MAKAARGNRTAAKRTPRKPRRAELHIEEPVEQGICDNCLRREALQFVSALPRNGETTIEQLLKDAQEVFDFIKGIPKFDFGVDHYKGSSLPTQVPDTPLPSIASSDGQVAHKSKFSEITM